MAEKCRGVYRFRDAAAEKSRPVYRFWAAGPVHRGGFFGKFFSPAAPLPGALAPSSGCVRSCNLDALLANASTCGSLTTRYLINFATSYTPGRGRRRGGEPAAFRTGCVTLGLICAAKTLPGPAAGSGGVALSGKTRRPQPAGGEAVHPRRTDKAQSDTDHPLCCLAPESLSNPMRVCTKLQN